METRRLACPQCAAMLDVPVGAVGRAAQCPHCGVKCVCLNTIGGYRLVSRAVAVTEPAVAAAALMEEAGWVKWLRRRRLLVIFAGVVLSLLVTLVFVLIYLRATQASAPDLRQESVAASKFWPRDLLLGVVISSPVQYFERAKEWRARLAEHAPGLLREWEEAEYLSSKGYEGVFGFDVQDTRAWAANGFDLRRPIHLASRIKDQGYDLMAALPVLNGPKALAVVWRVWEDPLLAKYRKSLIEPSPIRTSFGPSDRAIQATLASLERAGWLYLTLAQDEATGQQALETWLADSASASLADDQDFQATLKALPQGHETAVLLNAKPLMERRPEFFSGIPVLNAGVSWGQDGFGVLVAAKPDAEWLAQWETAGACRDFLERMPEPLAAVTYSLRDPGLLVERLVERTKVSEEEKKARTARLNELLRDGTGGLALYPRDGAGSFRVMGFLKSPKSKELATELLENWKSKAPAGELPRQRIGTDEFVNKDGTLVGTSGDWMILSTAQDQLRATLSDRRVRWKPATGTKDLLAIEVYLRPLARDLLAEDSMWREALEKLPDNCPLYATLDREGNVYRLQGKLPGWPEKFFCLLPYVEKERQTMRAALEKAKTK